MVWDVRGRQSNNQDTKSMVTGYGARDIEEVKAESGPCRDLLEQRFLAQMSKSFSRCYANPKFIGCSLQPNTGL